MENADSPVTVIIKRIVRPGSESAFEDAIRAFIPKALAFPGHLGVHMLRPSHGDREYGAVVKFRSQTDWTTFQTSEEYRAFLADIEAHLDGPQQVETLCGLESWFTPLGARVTRVPPRWKMATVTWVGVCITAFPVNQGFAWIASEWPGWLRFLVGNTMTVVILTWAIMPLLNRLFQPWLLPPAMVETS